MQRFLIPLWAVMLSTGVAVPILAQLTADHARALEASSSQSTPDKAKADQAKDLAIAAAELIGTKGLDDGCPEMRVSGGHFYRGETYAFIMDLKGVWRCFPPKPAAEGQSALEVQDPDGKLLVKEMNEIAATKGEGWVNYRWNNPATGKIEPKFTYIKRIPGTDLYSASGYYN
jgi:cytochrome c